MNEITLELTNQCNNRCLYCSSKANEGIIKHLEIDYIKDILNKYKPKQINLSGGEPFLYPYIFSLIEYLDKEKYLINIYTSGNYDNSYNYFTLLNNYKINKIIFNFNVNSQILFDYITQTYCSYIKTFDTIIMSQQFRFNTEVHIVPMTITLELLDNTMKYLLNDLKINKISLLKLINQGRCKDHEYLLLKDHSKLFKLKEKYGDKIRLGSPFNTKSICTAGKEKIVVKCDGEIIPCESYKDGICKCERIDLNGT